LRIIILQRYCLYIRNWISRTYTFCLYLCYAYKLIVFAKKICILHKAYLCEFFRFNKISCPVSNIQKYGTRSKV